MSNTSVDSLPAPIRNLVFLGSTGSGKSSTCNTLYKTKSEPFDLFDVGHDEVSCTENVSERVCKHKDLNIIDTPGFGNNKVTEENVDQVLRDIGLVFSEPDERNSRQIDAFVLVVRLTPRAQTLRGDVERVKKLFGVRAFKSLILLPIYDDCNYNKPDFLEQLKQMKEVVKAIKEGKSGELSSDWFCEWDNENPRENQEDELLEKIGKLKPYVQADFGEFTTLVKQTSDIKTKGDFEKDQTGGSMDAVSTMEELDENGREITVRKRENSMDKILRFIEMKHQSYSEDLDEALISNNGMIEQMMDRIEELEMGMKNIEQQRYFGALFVDLICCRRRLKPEEKAQLSKATLKKGAKVAVKQGAETLLAKGGQELIMAAKDTAIAGAKNYAKKKAKKEAKSLIAKTLCNMF